VSLIRCRHLQQLQLCKSAKLNIKKDLEPPETDENGTPLVHSFHKFTSWSPANQVLGQFVPHPNSILIG
jgi:hypothetical protein